MARLRFFAYQLILRMAGIQTQACIFATTQRMLYPLSSTNRSQFNSFKTSLTQEGQLIISHYFAFLPVWNVLLHPAVVEIHYWVSERFLDIFSLPFKSEFVVCAPLQELQHWVRQHLLLNWLLLVLQQSCFSDLLLGTLCF